MTIEQLLQDFYRENGLPKNGGDNQNTFRIKILGINFKLPNPKFRKDAIHVHDIEHVLNDCDVSWKGEGFISGWEISTGLWKHFPLGLLSLWTMGYSFWVSPKSVFKGFIKGINNIGIIDLKISKEEFMQMEYNELIELTSRKNKKRIGFLEYLQFTIWLVLSQVILFAPLIGILFLLLSL